MTSWYDENKRAMERPGLDFDATRGIFNGVVIGFMLWFLIVGIILAWLWL